MTSTTYKPIAIFDIDGTCADITHRKHFIEGKKQDWKSFNESARVDPPIKPTIVILMTLIHSGAFDIQFWTGRNEQYKPILLTWLSEHTGLPESFFKSKIKMRSDYDHRSDFIVKEEWLLPMSEQDRQRLLMVFEDRDQVVKMWRSYGVQCYQVAEGNY